MVVSDIEHLAQSYRMLQALSSRASSHIKTCGQDANKCFVLFFNELLDFPPVTYKLIKNLELNFFFIKLVGIPNMK